MLNESLHTPASPQQDLELSQPPASPHLDSIQHDQLESLRQWAETNIVTADASFLTSPSPASPPASLLDDSQLSQPPRDLTEIPSPAVASLGDYLQYICGSVQSQSELTLRLEDVCRRQNKLIHQLEDKIDSMNNKLQHCLIPPPASSNQRAESSPIPNPPTSKPAARKPLAPTPLITQPPATSLMPTPIYPVLPQIDPSPKIPRLHQFPRPPKFSCPDCQYTCT